MPENHSSNLSFFSVAINKQLTRAAVTDSNKGFLLGPITGRVGRLRCLARWLCVLCYLYVIRCLSFGPTCVSHQVKVE